MSCTQTSLTKLATTMNVISKVATIVNASENMRVPKPHSQIANTATSHTPPNTVN
jgi:hypothetical protein